MPTPLAPGETPSTTTDTASIAKKVDDNAAAVAENNEALKPMKVNKKTPDSKAEQDAYDDQTNNKKPNAPDTEAKTDANGVPVAAKHTIRWFRGAGHIPYSTKPAKDSMPRKRKNPASGSKPATKPKKQFKGPKLPGIDKPVAGVPFVSDKAPTAPKPATSPTPGVGVAKKPKSFI